MSDPQLSRANRVLDLVGEALERAPGDRAAFLSAACAGDEGLRADAQSLVDREAGARDFLSAPAFARKGLELLGHSGSELKPGDLIEDCRVIRLLGEGGMGEVYLAQDLKLERLVALKLLKRTLDDETLLRRFRHERRVLAGLTHPNIARLYGGAITPEGRAYLVMEYVEGERLDLYCEAAGLGVSGRLELFRKICAAVTYAHQNLVVHRDLKPANIRVTPAGEPKLLDFGVAKLLEADTGRPSGAATVTMFTALTPEYASPEQLTGETITTASDVYSLGVVLYELLTGQRPHAADGQRPEALARAIVQGEPARPSTVVGRDRAPGAAGIRLDGEPPARLRRRLEGDLDNIVAMALRKEPARRYASVAQLAEDLRRHSAGLPVAARKDTLRYRTGKFVRRNKVGVAAAGLVALALVGGLIATTWEARVARQERNRAQLAQVKAEAAEEQSARLNDFLQKLLASADPQRMGKDVKVVQVLDAASKSIDKELAGEPAILAQVHSTLSLAYGRLQILEPAEEQSRAALRLFQQLRGDDDPATILEKTRLGNVLNMRQRLPAAEPLLRQVVASLRRQPVPDAYALARALSLLGDVLAGLNRAPEAAPLLEEAVQRMRQARGENSTDYLMTLNSMGTLKDNAGDDAGAAAIYRQTVDLYRKIAPGNVSSVVPQINLCLKLFSLGKFDEAEAALGPAERDCQHTVGENNLYYGYILYIHALLDFSRGDYPKTIPAARKALELLDGGYARDNVLVVHSRALLGLGLTRAGQPAEGEPFLREALADGQNLQRPPFARTFGNLPSALGECLLAQKRLADAEPLLLQGYEEFKAQPGEHGAGRAAAADRLQALYTAWGKPTEAARFSGG